MEKKVYKILTISFFVFAILNTIRHVALLIINFFATWDMKMIDNPNYSPTFSIWDYSGDFYLLAINLIIILAAFFAYKRKTILTFVFSGISLALLSPLLFTDSIITAIFHYGLNFDGYQYQFLRNFTLVTKYFCPLILFILTVATLAFNAVFLVRARRNSPKPPC